MLSFFELVSHRCHAFHRHLVTVNKELYRPYSSVQSSYSLSKAVSDTPSPKQAVSEKVKVGTHYCLPGQRTRSQKPLRMPRAYKCERESFCPLGKGCKRTP